MGGVARIPMTIFLVSRPRATVDCQGSPCPRSMQTPITIVNPVMGVWPKDAPDKQEEITMKFVSGKGWLAMVDFGWLVGWQWWVLVGWFLPQIV